MKNNLKLRKSVKKMGSATTIILTLIAVAIIIIGGGYYFAKVYRSPIDKSTQNEPAQPAQNESTQTNGDDEGNKTTGQDNTPPDEDAPASSAGYSGTVLAGQITPLLDFNKADYDAAIASDKLIVLYFYANWCPICKQETASSLYPAFNKLANKNVVGFQVSFNDNQTDKDEKALAKEFGVVYQHTKIFVKNRTRILKSLEAWTEDRYLSEINKAANQ